MVEIIKGNEETGDKGLVEKVDILNSDAQTEGSVANIVEKAVEEIRMDGGDLDEETSDDDVLDGGEII